MNIAFAFLLHWHVMFKFSPSLGLDVEAQSLGLGLNLEKLSFHCSVFVGHSKIIIY